MPAKHHTTRNDLFLVRFWLQDMGSDSDGQNGWGGKVQRAVSGESYEFNDWEALIKALRAMLAATSPSFMVDGLLKTNNSTSESGERGE